LERRLVSTTPPAFLDAEFAALAAYDGGHFKVAAEGANGLHTGVASRASPVVANCLATRKGVIVGVLLK